LFKHWEINNKRLVSLTWFYDFMQGLNSAREH
jgi:hypothetical protein